MSAANDSLSSVWSQALALSPGERVELAQRLLRSVAPSPPTGRPADVIGMWKVPNPPPDVEQVVAPLASPQLRPADLIGDLRMPNPPDDDEVERILDEARLQKYG